MAALDVNVPNLGTTTGATQIGYNEYINDGNSDYLRTKSLRFAAGS